jgi:hypothetical protein
LPDGSGDGTFWNQIECVGSGRKCFGGETVLGQIEFAFARLSIDKLKDPPSSCAPLLYCCRTLLYFFLNTIIDMETLIRKVNMTALLKDYKNTSL